MRSERILYVHPGPDHSAEPCDDELTAKMERLFLAATIHRTWRGFHTAVCGQRSSSRDYLLPDGEHITNSLCVHYLRWHRGEIPETELQKVRDL